MAATLDQQQLPFAEPHALLSWLPDETLFSWASRHHALSGNALAEQTSKQLFGARRRGYQHDFPSGIDEFCARTRGALGNASEIIQNRTLLPFYLPFHHPNQHPRFAGQLRGPLISSLKAQLGLLGRLRAHHPLKACEQCMQEDREQHGLAYWHRVHQLPGVWLCPTHMTPLREAQVKANGVNRFGWLLPDAAVLRAPYETELPHDPDSSLRKLASASTAILSLPSGFYFEHSRLQATWRAALDRKALLTKHGSIRLSALVSQYAEFCAPLRFVPDLQALPSSIKEAEAQIGRLLRPPRSVSHPVRILTAVCLLFKDWAAFLQEFEIQSVTDLNATPVEQASAVPWRSRFSDKKKELARLLKVEGSTPADAAAFLNIDIRTVYAWAIELGIKIDLGPHELPPRLRARVVRELRAGGTHGEVGQHLNIDRIKVRYVAMQEPGLQNQSRSARFEATREKWRDALLIFLGENRQLSRSDIRDRFVAGWAWLNRYDRTWLNARMPKPAKPKRHNPQIDWINRDKELSQKILDAGATIRRTRPGKRIPQWAVYQAVPTLRCQLRHIRRLPLTRSAIDSCCKQVGVI